VATSTTPNPFAQTICCPFEIAAVIPVMRANCCRTARRSSNSWRLFAGAVASLHPSVSAATAMLAR